VELFKAVYPSISDSNIVSTYFTFEDVKVPVENLIGKENEGFKVLMTSIFFSYQANKTSIMKDWELQCISKRVI
jgi:hypothetical protein